MTTRRNHKAKDAGEAAQHSRSLMKAAGGTLPPARRSGLQTDTIFVSIASYRDPQLAPTVCDCLKKARHPERLRFAICWQHGDEEVLPGWFAGGQFAVLDVDWRESGGACWARAEIMGLWRGEDWYLQLDSHHRFIQDWDVRLLEQAALSASNKPILSAFPPHFTLDGDAALAPLLTAFDRFDEDGIPLPIGWLFPDWRPGLPPRRTRFLSAAFLLAPGSFVKEVPYDPALYFHGEETMLTLRAFTHGYDPFQPCDLLLWHLYARDYRTKHWDDHVLERGVEIGWGERDARSRERIKRFLAEPFVGHFGLGSERTFADYEAYAGISFKHRRAQDYTRAGLEPPNPPADPDWATHVRDRRVTVEVDLAQLPSAAVEDPTFWYVGVHDGEGRELYRRDLDSSELDRLLAAGESSIVLERCFESEAEPASWTVIPHSASCGWLGPLTQEVQDPGGHDLGSWFPVRVHGLALERSDGGYIVRGQLDGVPAHLLNDTGALLLQIADGSQSVLELTALVRQLCGLDEDSVEQIVGFYEQALVAGLVTKANAATNGDSSQQDGQASLGR